MKKEEERLLRHLEKSAGKLDDILKVEHELTRIRGEIERRQGQQNFMAKLTAMTTVTITIRERSSYVPPEAAWFGSTLTRTFGTSWESLVGIGKGLLLVVVALVPWPIPFGLIGVPGWPDARLHLSGRPLRKLRATLARVARSMARHQFFQPSLPKTPHCMYVRRKRSLSERVTAVF